MGALPRLKEIREPMARRWTIDEYTRLCELGFFNEKRVELIDGEIIEMCMQDPSHIFSWDNIAEALREKLGSNFWVRTQAQLNLSANSAPEPDVSVVSGKRLDYIKRHPTTALLVIEIANTSLNYDRNWKSPIYAAAGIADYWIVNFPDWRVDVLREPRKLDNGTFQYSSVRSFKIGEFVSPLFKPELKIAVADLLPPEKLVKEN